MKILITPKMVEALRLLAGNDGGMSADDPRGDRFADDGSPDTWNKLFDAGLAEQSGPGWSGDDFILNITEAGRAALKARP